MRDEQEVRVIRYMAKRELAAVREADGPLYPLPIEQHQRLLIAQEVLTWVLGSPLPWLEAVLTDQKAARRCP